MHCRYTRTYLILPSNIRLDWETYKSLKNNFEMWEEKFQKSIIDTEEILRNECGIQIKLPEISKTVLDISFSFNLI